MIPNNALPPVHPGKFLQEILEELGISQAAFARDIGLSPMRISHVIKGDRPVTAEMALLRLSHIHRKAVVEVEKRAAGISTKR